ncbi:putative butyrate kinase [Tepidanaerobacter acetatoxydans Re1]|uniref:Probable butyrate kinase n=1 Tax=Tepidanaerobacter acetatoxydans (strain DSM 21804 / JCM 16047 / Re1) TaxID=1209989 RepID=F4LS10_TEPAE|nr:butyrate kinase [Tepidanaerobacter acetatoxydans]AEE92349.1 butyrate kinase [Tepidanaerobacter acetatoxydans Re1]CCP27237.1 putative butyrate kinase [Tepidanaerobacter acetatoxydans Re1]
MKILVINPGSTSTKVAIYEDERELFVENIPIKLEELKKYKTIYDQLDMRYWQVVTFLEKHGFSESNIDVIVSRGGMLPPVHSGAYVIDDKLVETLRYHPSSLHASNLGALIAHKIAKPGNIPAYIYDSVAVDELSEIAHLSGIKGRNRKSYSHVLNTRAVARRYCMEKNLDYTESTLIVVHLGGGISVNIQKGGKVIDVVTAEEGPFSPERAGGLQVLICIDICNEEGIEKLQKYESGAGGFVSYLGTNDARKVESLVVKGDPEAKIVYQALAYQVAKAIGALATVEKGKIDAILLTGGIAYSKILTDWIKEYVQYIAPVSTYPGEFEMQALALGALRVMRKEEVARQIEEDFDFE